MSGIDFGAIRDWLVLGGGLALIVRFITDVRGQNKTTTTTILASTQTAQGAFADDLAARLATVEERLAAVEDERDAEKEARYKLQEEYFGYREGARQHVSHLTQQIWQGTAPGTRPVDPPAGFTL